MEYTTSKERSKIIKKALTNHYGHKNVSVRKGRGTACGWVEATVNITPPHNCTCKPESIGRCKGCKECYQYNYNFINHLTNKALRENGTQHSFYYADDGYNTETSEFLVQINIDNHGNK